jgi:hypothetical protein
MFSSISTIGRAEASVDLDRRLQHALDEHLREPDGRLVIDSLIGFIDN